MSIKSWLSSVKVFALVVLALTQSPSSTAQDTASDIPKLAPSYRTATLSNPKTGHPSAPYHDHGYLIQIEHVPQTVGAPNVYLYNSAGQNVHDVALWPDGATKLWLAWAAVGPGNQLAVSGQAIMASKSSFNFIAVSNLDGTGLSYISTGRYLAMQMCLAADGSIWTIGTELNKNPDPLSKANYDVFRHYSKTGDLLEHFLPRTDLVADYKYSWKYPSQVYLRSSDSMIVLYDGISEQIYEYDTTSQVLRNWKITGASASTMAVTGFGVTSSNHVYASLIGSGDRALATRGLFGLVIDTPSGSAVWQPIPGTVLPQRSDPLTLKAVGSFLFLLGCEGDDVVYRTQQVEPSPFTVSWSHR